MASVEPPLAMDPATMLTAARLVARAQYLGVLPTMDDPQELSRALLQSIADALSRAGVARSTGLLLRSTDDVAGYRALLESLLDQTEHSPLPTTEWPPLIEVLGEDVLGDLLGISASSLRRYTAGTRSTPQDVAARLHIVALLVADLSGAYNDYGIRRWFTRRRTQLDEKAPRELLGSDFDPDGADVGRLREMAGRLVGAGAT
jgi:hypothetical protein